MENTAIEISSPRQGTCFDYSFGGDLRAAYKFAEVLCVSDLLPKEFHKNPASTMIALDYAARVRRNPFEIMQAMYIVHGRPSFSSAFLISLINSCGHYEPLRFKFNEKRNACYAWTKDKRTGEEVRGTTITMEMATAEGWTTKSGSKWKTMPEIMLQYRAAAFFYRANCPDLMGSFQTTDELIDVESPEPPRGARLAQPQAVGLEEPQAKSEPEIASAPKSKAQRMSEVMEAKAIEIESPAAETQEAFEDPEISPFEEPQAVILEEPQAVGREEARKELVSLLNARGFADEKARKALFKRVLNDADAKTITMTLAEINKVIDAIYTETV